MLTEEVRFGRVMRGVFDLAIGGRTEWKCRDG